MGGSERKTDRQRFLIEMLLFLGNRFLKKLLTEDLPLLFVRPKKIVLDFQKGQALGPLAEILKTDVIQEGNKDFVGELSVTVVDARKLAYVLFGTYIYFVMFYYT